ncbi:hypothetical protein N5A93_06335 [Roseovarius sp. EGI FJ00037]|uniref:hypothetical protein n=1 Tax=Roseovarius salincola TaxID=2978479 RepID=UPI0022A81E80|nr:hypothetical protein [Roseovarius sp. EGI FJ00037]MCZ0811844.1 hypothetical protein [Roseovarius sp. EGI FJ00037]
MPENQRVHRKGCTSLEGEPHKPHVATHQQTTEEAEELIFSITTHAMREPDYSREKNGIMAMTIAHAREDQNKIDEKKRAIHQRLGPIEARMKQRVKREQWEGKE